MMVFNNFKSGHNSFLTIKSTKSKFLERLSSKYFPYYLIYMLVCFSARQKKCESDKDCLKGKAKCVRRLCQCTEKYEFGDGLNSCESGKYKNFCNNPLSMFLKNLTDQYFSFS